MGCKANNSFLVLQVRKMNKGILKIEKIYITRTGKTRTLMSDFALIRSTSRVIYFKYFALHPIRIF